ncbi:hypothetical protein [Nostoc favosum]|uniref:Uncharacterized protein n=1 Tax=Nostoc favosum CHAB5714 TaxID=2780399 RepID=A0ABS8I4A6_9NOSO|nr:hypothetical protein [Nostoc favosum]MCC5598998.1 hypothetical protein [Nostoc favosum CHAB5714]
MSVQIPADFNEEAVLGGGTKLGERGFSDFCTDYEQCYRERTVNNLHKRAQQLGFELIPQPQANAVS